MNQLLAVPALTQDQRRVQTAVTGQTADSDEAVVLPMDRDEARRFLDAHPDAHYWCGIHQGGCGKRLHGRTPRHCVAHFYHLGSDPERRCRRLSFNRGRRDNDPVIALREVRFWRESRDLREEKVVHSEDHRSVDARYLDVIGLPGTRNTRVVVGDCASDELIREAKSSRGREVDWLVHHENNVILHQLRKNGIAYAVIRFKDEDDTTTVMQVSTKDRPREGDWTALEQYVPEPNQPKPEPVSPLLLRDTRQPAFREVPPKPRRSPDSQAPHQAVPEPKRNPAPIPVERPEVPLSDGLREAASLLEDALILKDARGIRSGSRSVQRLWNAQAGRVFTDDEQWIKGLLSQAGHRH